MAFKPDYLQRGVTPNLNALIADGVRAEKMLPSFPSITFPNHYTLVTGLRPDHHGIVGNTMIDPAIPGVRFSLGNRDAVIDRRWWDQAEPVWVTAEKMVSVPPLCSGQVQKRIFMVYVRQSGAYLMVNYRQKNALIRCWAGSISLSKKSRLSDAVF
jgi:hypothetical protein